jgi:hypothetical protein
MFGHVIEIPRLEEEEIDRIWMAEFVKRFGLMLFIVEGRGGWGYWLMGCQFVVCLL